MNINKSAVVFPGTFDPITLGHQDLIFRAAKLFGHVIVGVAENRNKKTMLSLDERVELCKKSLSQVKNITVHGFNCLLVDFAAEHNINTVIRGLRVVTDFEYEFQLANMNRQLSADFETVFLTPSERFSFISSTLVREVSALGGDISAFVSPDVVKLMKEKI